jgi:IS5 family transposase
LNILKNQAAYYSGKKQTHTLKLQLVVEEPKGSILQVTVAQANVHNITLARQQTDHLPSGTVCLVDSGYQGCSVVWPFKKHKGREREPEEKRFNQRLAHVRIKVEQRIRCLKIFRILKGIYRGRRQRFDLRFDPRLNLT